MRRVRGLARHPALLVVLLAPYFGEGLSGSTPPLDLVLPWNLAFMAALYGCGALLCREIAHRFGLGFRGLVLLAVAYAVWEEALVDRYWFYPTFWETSGVDSYSVVWHTNVLLAAHLTAFHTAISICSSVLVVEWLTPRYRDRPWVGRRGLVLAAVALVATPVVYGEFDRRPPSPVLVAAAMLLLGVVAAAFVVGRARRPAAGRRDPQPALRVRQRRGVGVLAFTCVLIHWFVTYSVPATGVPWPIGVALALTPILVGVLVIPRLAVTGPYGADGVRVVVGLVTFFVLLDIVVGLAGRYDLVISAVITAFALHRLRRRFVGPARPLRHAPTAH